ncbi:MAG: hypothetical protein FJ276_25210 [Planctomycetes bacterium]|nr:hypothetical protein [Planctomycetota bacterium]
MIRFTCLAALIALLTSSASSAEPFIEKRDGSRSSLQQAEPQNAGRPKVLLVVGDGAEVMDTLYPFFRLGERYQVVVAAPQRRRYHLVIHELAEGWDITQERAGYHLESDATFQEVKSEEYVALVLPGGRAPEYLRYDADLMRITKDFFAANKPVASVCHGIEILATADVLPGRKVTTIPLGPMKGAYAIRRSGSNDFHQVFFDPDDPRDRAKGLEAALLPTDPEKRWANTDAIGTAGYPDVDTYRDFYFYLHATIKAPPAFPNP